MVAVSRPRLIRAAVRLDELSAPLSLHSGATHSHLRFVPAQLQPCSPRLNPFTATALSNAECWSACIEPLRMPAPSSARHIGIGNCLRLGPRVVDPDHLCLAVPISYKFKSGSKTSTSHDYDNARSIADALFGHSRLKMPYRLLIIGY